MFASLFRKKPASTIRRGSPRVRLGLETLEDRTVPSTLLSNLGPTGAGVELFNRPATGGVEVKTEQVSVSPSAIGRVGDGVELLNRPATGGIEVKTEQVSVSPSAIGRPADAIELFNRPSSSGVEV